MSLTSFYLEDVRHLAVVRTRPRAIPLAMISTRISIHGFPLVSYMGMGLRLAALRRASLKTRNARTIQAVNVRVTDRSFPFRLLKREVEGGGWWLICHSVPLFCQISQSAEIQNRFNCKTNRPLALRGQVTIASFKQWVVILLLPKIDRTHKNYLTTEIWEETFLLIFQQNSMICIGHHVGGILLPSNMAAKTIFCLYLVKCLIVTFRCV